MHRSDKTYSVINLHPDSEWIVAHESASYAMKRRISELRSDGTVTQFIYDGWQEIEEITNNTITASYIYDDGIDHPIAMISNNHAYYYHADTRNNIAAITDENGALIERYSYDPYGAATITDELGQVITESTIGNSYRFSSRRYDAATGLYYYRHRMYTPELGRFLQRDPVGYADGMNVYKYVRNNPIKWTDPFGELPGDHYPTQDDAAAAAVTDINLRSIAEGREYGGLIYHSRADYYSYTEPIAGDVKQVQPYDAKSPAGTGTTAYYHTHGDNNPAYDNEHFSPRDKDLAKYYNDDAYLGTPKGNVYRFDVSSSEITKVGSVSRSPKKP